MTSGELFIGRVHASELDYLIQPTEPWYNQGSAGWTKVVDRRNTSLYDTNLKRSFTMWMIGRNLKRSILVALRIYGANIRLGINV